MDAMFIDQIMRNFEIYIDDMVVKMPNDNNHCKDLEDILRSVRKYNMGMSTTKCSFRVHVRKFLGFMLTRSGIEANQKYFRP